MAVSHDSSALESCATSPRLSDQGFFLEVLGHDEVDDRLLRFGAGDYLAVEPLRQPAEGDLVLTVVEDGRALVALHVGRDGGEMALEKLGHLRVAEHDIRPGALGVVTGRWIPT